MKKIVCFTFAFIFIFYTISTPVLADNVLSMDNYIEINDIFDYTVSSANDTYYNYIIKKDENKINKNDAEDVGRDFAEIRCYYKAPEELKNQYTEEYASSMGKGFVVSDFSLDTLDEYTSNVPDKTYFVYVKKDGYFFTYQFGDQVNNYEVVKKNSRISFLAFNIGDYTFMMMDLDKTKYDYVTQNADETVKVIKKLEDIINNGAENNDTNFVLVTISALAAVLVAVAVGIILTKRSKKAKVGGSEETTEEIEQKAD